MLSLLVFFLHACCGNVCEVEVNCIAAAPPVRERPSHFFKYCTHAVAKIVLSTSRIRWSSPLLFNDPFDCYFSIEPKFDVAELERTVCDRFVDVVCGEEEPKFVPGNPYVPILQQFRAYQSKSPELLRKIIREVYPLHVASMRRLSDEARSEWLTESADYRLFCVCESKDNLLLWSHYTDCHRGVAFQFEAIEELDVPLLEARPVMYSEEAPGLTTAENWVETAVGLHPIEEAGESLWIRLVTTKARSWEHEKEWRVVTKRRDYESQGYEDTAFDPREISKIFLGCKMAEETRTALLEARKAQFSHAEVYQAKQSSRRFALDFERIA